MFVQGVLRREDSWQHGVPHGRSAIYDEHGVKRAYSDDKQLVVTPQGRLLLRAVAMVFDAYVKLKREQTITFSRIA